MRKRVFQSSRQAAQADLAAAVVAEVNQNAIHDSLQELRRDR